MIKILYITHNRFPWDVRTDKICNSLIDSGFEVFLLTRCYPNQSQSEKFGNINILRVGSNKDFWNLPISINPAWRKALNETVRNIKPDLLIVREMYLAEAVSDIGKKFNIPAIIDMAENYPAAMRAWKKYSKNFLRRLIVHTLKIPDIIEKRAVKKADGIILVCNEQIQRLSEFYNYPADKICIAHNTPKMNTSGNSAKSANNPPRIYGHHGYLSADKNIELLIEAFDIVADTYLDISLLIAGGGECYDDIKQLVEKCNNKGRINLMGNYNHKDLPEILEKIDIGVIPYELNDFNNYTIHNKIFDYFAFAKPVIATPMIPTKRIIEETQAGWVLQKYSVDAMVNTIIKSQNDNTIEEKSINAYNSFINKYNWDNDFNNLLQFLKKYI